MDTQRSEPVRTVLLLAVVMLLCSLNLQFAAAQEAAQTAAPTRLGPVNRAELEAFMDGVIAAQREAHHIVGATVSVVANGTLFFSKGYGYADMAEKKRVRPDSTLFRIGSVSKLFTWTAVMQLAEQGKLDLNQDINTYLSDIRIPSTFPQPITMAHLMSHTPGFEDLVVGLFARNEGGMKPLGRLLSGQIPARVRPPGQLASYSNHGTAIAGYIVQQISGMPWEEYIEEKILRPLEMNHTTVRQPIPEHLAADMSVGYSYSGGDYVKKDFEFVPAMPAGSMSACAEDMAKFMIAHLQNGRYGQTRILSEETAERMHSPLFRHSRELNAMLHGFYEVNTHGQRIFGHGGDTLWFHTDMVLLPEHQVGLFVSFNSDSGGRARSELVKAFLKHYYPPPESPTLTPPADFRQNADHFAGSYRSTRVSHTTLTKVMMLMTLNVSATDDGYLRTTGLGADPKKWVAVEPLVFEEVNGEDTLVFREDEQGNITHLFVNSLPILAFIKLQADETPVFHFGLLGLSLLIMLSAVLIWPISAYRHRGSRWEGAPPPLARFAGWVGSFLCLATAIGIVVSLSDPNEIVFGIPPLLDFVLLLPFLAALFVFGTVILTLMTWAKGYWRFSRRIHYTLVALAGIVFIWWLYYWNLMGVRLF